MTATNAALPPAWGTALSEATAESISIRGYDLAALTAVSGGATLQAGAAAGLLTLGEFHGAAVDASMQAIAAVVDDVATRGRARADAADRLVAARRAEGRRVPGF